MENDWIIGILGVWAIWSASWLIAARWTNRTVGRPGARREAGYQLLTFAGFGLLFGDGWPRPAPHGIAIVPAFHLPALWHSPAAFGWAMAGVALAGMALAWWARLSLGRLWSAAVTRKDGHKVVDTGPYAIVRHPIYTGLLMGSFALAFSKGTPLALVGLALLLIAFRIKARLEERFLAEELGHDAYAAYRARVPMLLPFAPAG